MISPTRADICLDAGDVYVITVFFWLRWLATGLARLVYLAVPHCQCSYSWEAASVAASPGVGR